MTGTHVAVRCLDCEFREEYSKLPEARSALDAHESETDHTVNWQIEKLSSGVERAGADAGVCGRSGCVNEDSPLFQGSKGRSAEPGTPE